MLTKLQDYVAQATPLVLNSWLFEQLSSFLSSKF